MNVVTIALQYWWLFLTLVIISLVIFAYKVFVKMESMINFEIGKVFNPKTIIPLVLLWIVFAISLLMLALAFAISIINYLRAG